MSKIKCPFCGKKFRGPGASAFVQYEEHIIDCKSKDNVQVQPK